MCQFVCASNSYFLVQKSVILESRGILKIDYTQEFAAVTTPTTTSTTEATPPLPEVPTTTKPLVPTKYNTPETLPTQARTLNIFF